MARRDAPENRAGTGSGGSGSDPGGPQGTDAPWAAFGYLVAGVGFYGLIGWGLGTWLHVTYLTPIGIVVGAVLGIYLVYSRLARPPQDVAKNVSTAEKHVPPEQSERPDDRGEAL